MRFPLRRRALTRRRREALRQQLPNITAEQAVAAADLPTPDDRAFALLRAHLTPHQWYTLQTQQYIELLGSEGTRYCLHAEPRVYELDADGYHVRGFCSYVSDPYFVGLDTSMPRADHILAHLLLVQGNERKFRRIAPELNVTRMFRHREYNRTNVVTHPLHPAEGTASRGPA